MIKIDTSELKEAVLAIIKEAFEESQPSPEPASPKEELLTVAEVAKLLKTTTANIHAKKKAGQIPFVRFGGKVLFKRSEVIESLPSIHIRPKK